MLHFIQRRLLRMFLIGSIFAGNVMPVWSAEIAIMPVTVPRGTVVLLGDVAKVRAADKLEADRLAAIPLLPAPAPGRQRFLRMREIQDLLAAHGEDLRQLDFCGERVVEIGPAPVNQAYGKPQVDRRAIWAGTTVATVAGAVEANPPQAIQPPKLPEFTAAQTIELQQQLERAIFEHLDRNSGRKADWQLAFDVKPTDLAKVLAAKTTLQCSGGASPWTGTQRFVVAFSTSRGPARVRVEALVTATQPVVVAIRPIDRGRVITAADVAIEERENVPATTARRSLVDSLQSLIGMEAMRPIQAGDPIFSDDFRPQLLVKRGEEIAVVARGGGIQVRSVARATQDGARGELISVESLESKEAFHAVVVGAREAVVFTGGSAPMGDDVAEQPFRSLRQK